jgi:hypothetical protein
MATYKGINGFAVQSVATDPSPLDEGQVWYNNATYAFKLASVTTAGTWATGGNLNIGRAMTSVTGIQTASVINGGAQAPVGPAYWSYQNATENYNGTSWTASGAPGTARYAPFLVGTQTTALGGAGQDTLGSGYSSVQYYDGATWTSAPSVSSGRGSVQAGGTQTSAVIAGGAGAGSPGPAATEEFNGTSWTSGGNLGTGRYQLQGHNIGTQTATLCIGGYVSGPTAAVNLVESYNGTSWTAGTNLPSARGNQARFGTQTSALSCGPSTTTELYNGTSWSAETAFSNVRGTAAGCGTTGSGLLAGAFPPTGTTAATEEWTGAGAPVTRTITTS